MTPTQKTQVVIVGAGPSGLSMASQLLRYGIDFILIEKNEKTTHLSKAVVIQARTLEIFQEQGLAQKAIERGRQANAFNMFYKGKKKATLDLTGMGNGLSAFPFALSLEQSKTEKLLVEHLAENGKSVVWKSEFLRYEENNGITVFYKDAHGEEQQIQAQYLVGSDGASSPIRHQMDVHFEGDTIPKIFYVADVDLSSPIINKDQLFVFLIQKGFVLFFPMEGQNHYRVIGILPDKTEDDEFTFEDIQDSIKKDIVIPIQFNELKWFSSYKVHSRKADAFQKGNCFIIGDAAHIHTPAGGQGMNTGIQDAYNLAWKLAYKINYNVNQNVVESYNSERTENAKRLLNTTDRMFDFLTGTNVFWNFLRLHIFPYFMRFVSKSPSLNKFFFPLLSQIGIAYPNSSLTIPGKLGKVKSGDRMPYFVFSDSKTIYDYIGIPAFKILFFGTEDNADYSRLHNLKFKVETLAFDQCPKKNFGAATNFYVLLRPDNHISYIGNDFESCLALLQQIAKGS